MIRKQHIPAAAAVVRPPVRLIRTEAAHKDMVDSRRRRAGEAPFRRHQVRERTGTLHAEIEVTGKKHPLVRQRQPVDEDRRPQELGVGEPLVGIARRMQVADDERLLVMSDANGLADAPLLGPVELRRGRQSHAVPLRTAEAKRVEDDAPVLDDRQPRPQQECVGLSGDGRAKDEGVVRAEDATEHRGDPRAAGNVRDGCHSAPVFEVRGRPDRHLLQAHDVRRVRGDEPHHLLEERLRPRRIRLAVEQVPGPDEQALYCTAMRIALADPPAFTPAYDHELAAALARTGNDVELVTSRFRFGDAPTPGNYSRSEVFYPLSSRMFRRSPLRLPLKAAEHAPGMVALLRRRPDVLHLQWLAAPELDRYLFHARVPTVFTAHDLLPRRTARKVALWRALLARFDRVVVHSERGRQTLAELGVDATVIPHPVYASDPPRADDGRTLLSLGMIRPYKGLGDAIEAAKRIDGARLLVAGDPLEPLNGYRAAAGDVAEWRLGYLPQQELERALGEATVALFPYRPELDQSGALLQALGAGVPAVAYDVGGIAEPIRTFGAGRVVAAGDIDALVDATRELLEDEQALAAARAGARRAREALTWDAAAAAHLELYRQLT